MLRRVSRATQALRKTDGSEERMGRLGKILKVGCLTMVALLLLAMAGLAVFVWHVRRTTPPWPERVPGVRLEPSRPLLREADVKPDNAYYFIRQLTNWHASLKIPIDEMQTFRARGYRPNAYPQLEGWLVTNAPALQLVAQAATMTNAQVVTYTPTNMLLSCLSEVLTIGKILPYRVQRDVWRQDWLAVSNDFHQTIQLAEHMSRGGVLIHTLVGLSVSLARLQQIVDDLNNRPRKQLGWRTPAEKMAEILTAAPHGGRAGAAAPTVRPNPKP
ncbi:MAG: hypothetical protein NTY53_02690 [Kiritimatiellaeota bacterium]|nr:hypothetical protein [Kiritimatiellota bacterium]